MSNLLNETHEENHVDTSREDLPEGTVVKADPDLMPDGSAFTVTFGLWESEHKERLRLGKELADLQLQQSVTVRELERQSNVARNAVFFGGLMIIIMFIALATLYIATASRAVGCAS